MASPRTSRVYPHTNENVASATKLVSGRETTFSPTWINDFRFFFLFLLFFFYSQSEVLCTEKKPFGYIVATWNTGPPSVHLDNRILRSLIKLQVEHTRECGGDGSIFLFFYLFFFFTLTIRRAFIVPSRSLPLRMI